MHLEIESVINRSLCHLGFSFHNFFFYDMKKTVIFRRLSEVGNVKNEIQVEIERADLAQSVEL